MRELAKTLYESDIITNRQYSKINDFIINHNVVKLCNYLIKLLHTSEYFKINDFIYEINNEIYSCVKKIIELNININEINHHKILSIIYEKGDMNIIKHFENTDNAELLITKAVQRGYVSMIKNKSITDYNKYYLLACEYGQLEVIKYLESMYQISVDIDECLKLLCDGRHLFIIKYLKLPKHYFKKQYVIQYAFSCISFLKYLHESVGFTEEEFKEDYNDYSSYESLVIDFYDVNVIKYLHTQLNFDYDYFNKNMYLLAHAFKSVDALHYLNETIGLKTYHFKFDECYMLRYACIHGYLDSVIYLVDNCGIDDENFQYISSNTFEYICNYGCLGIIKYLTEKKNVRYNISTSLLRMIVNNNNYDIIEYLDNVYCFDDQTKFYIAQLSIINDNVNIFMKYEKYKYYNELMSKILKCGSLRIMKYMLNTYDVTFTDSNILTLCEHNNYNLFKYLCDNDFISIDMISMYKLLSSVFVTNNIKFIRYMCRILNANKYDIKMVLGDRKNYSLELLLFLHEKMFFDVNDFMNCKEFILSFVCLQGYLECIKFLHEQMKCTTNYFICDNCEPFKLACSYGILEYVKYYCEELKITRDDVKNEINDILIHTCNSKSLDILEYLHDHFNLTIEDYRENDNKILKTAHQNQLLSIVRYLHCEIGLTIDDFRCDDNYCLRIVFENNDYYMFRYLAIDVGLTYEDITLDNNYLIEYATENMMNDMLELCSENYGIMITMREDFSVNGEEFYNPDKVVNEEHLELQKCNNNEEYICDICTEECNDDIKYMPLCCRKYGKNICKECASNSLGVQAACCPFCRCLY